MEPRLSALDVAEYILRQMGPLSAIKLQKLVYYCQAWSLVWDEAPIFKENIQAWRHGPVIPELYAKHRTKLRVSPGEIKPDAIEPTGPQKDTIDAVIRDYGADSAFYLAEQTHREPPWRDARARANALPGDDCREIIGLDDIAEYFFSRVQ